MATSKRLDGPTPHGGAYAVATFTNERGEIVDESVATWAVAAEFDEDGNEIGSAYYRVRHDGKDGGDEED